jgi:hypothetical protein
MKRPKQNPNEAYCHEVMSLVVVEEEQNLLLLCRIGICPADAGIIKRVSFLNPI